MILIVGAGLSGLLTAYRLKKAGIPFKVLEARNRTGGRINTVLKPNAIIYSLDYFLLNLNFNQYLDRL